MNPRLQGALVFLVGVCLAVLFRYEYRSGGEIFSDQLLCLTPLIVLAGFSYMIEPCILIANKKDGPSLPVVFKAANYVILAVGLVVGIYIRYVVFKDWH